MFYECNRGDQFFRASSATRGAYFDKLDASKESSSSTEFDGRTVHLHECFKIMKILLCRSI